MENQDMSDVNKPDFAFSYTVVFAIFLIFMIPLVNDEVLVGQPLWLRCTATGIGAAVLMWVFALIQHRFKRS